MTERLKGIQVSAEQQGEVREQKKASAPFRMMVNSKHSKTLGHSQRSEQLLTPQTTARMPLEEGRKGR